MTGWENPSGRFLSASNMVDHTVDDQKGYQRAQQNVCEDKNLFGALIKHLRMPPISKIQTVYY